MPVPKRTPGQRAGLTREAVLTEARVLLADDGLGGLSMRRLADRLGVAPNALYSHVGGKTDLIDALLDDTLAAVRPPDPRRGDWRRGLETIMRRTYVVLLEHPALVGLYLARQGARGPNAVALGEVMLALMARGGVVDARALEARHVLIVYTIGFAAFAIEDPLGRPAQGPRTPRALAANFEHGLRWLLDGIAAGEAV
jgi:TetR/AcrR family tetracycline transcriptional repressor